ncbi:MAG TPA: hypothetical protein VK866_16690, partial [Acidimicrobiales bacterium]|nr:hypothetical protein [Acidimicrobiales bacterium]
HGTDRALRVILGVPVVVLAIWVVGAVRVARRLPTTAAVLLAPLGLRVTEVPSMLLAGTAPMRGALTIVGRRHGRDVTVTQTPSRSLTEVRGVGAPATGSWTPARMAALTGLRVGTLRDVEVRESDGAVTVTRSGNGAGRWFLHDLVLAEAVADRRAAGERGSAR